MSDTIYNRPIQLLSNEEVNEVVTKAIQDEKKNKGGKHVHKSQLISEKTFFKSKLFNRSYGNDIDFD